MAVEKMKMLTVGGVIRHLDKILASCCLDGIIHTEPTMQHISHSMGFTSLVEENKYADRLNAINELADSFGVQLTLIDSENDLKKIDEDNEYIESLSSRINAMQEEKKKISSQIDECTKACESLSHFSQMEIPLNEIIECKFVKFRFGYIPYQSLSKLKVFEDKNSNLMFFECSRDNDKIWGVYFATLDNYEEVDRFFASLYFERLIIPNSYETPEKAIEGYKQKIEQLKEQLDKIEQEFSLIWKAEKENINRVYSRLAYGNAIHEIRSNVAVLDDSFCYMGWVAESDCPEIEKRLKKIKGIDWEWDRAEDLDESHVPPTKLKNNKLIKPYESFVAMYGLPNYKEFDPTTVFGLMYTILFGIMFADVGQGFVLALGGYILGKKKNSDLGRIFARCGVSSMFFGVVFGSVFGFEDALNWFWRLFGMQEKPISILDSTLGIILMGIYIGVGLIYMFMFLNIYKCIKQKHFGRAVFSESGLAGLITYTGGVIAIAQFLNKELSLLPTGACVAMIGLGLVMLFFKELLISKIDKEELGFDGPGDYIITNAIELLEYVISYFTNTLSFLRVGIFVMVHAVMMNVVFTLAPDPSSNIVGFIITVVIGNIIVAALECLLTYIQVLRLGFYEMFSRFYDGDGVEFKTVNLRKRKTTN